MQTALTSLFSSVIDVASSDAPTIVSSSSAAGSPSIVIVLGESDGPQLDPDLVHAAASVDRQLVEAGARDRRPRRPFGRHLDRVPGDRHLAAAGARRAAQRMKRADVERVGVERGVAVEGEAASGPGSAKTLLVSPLSLTMTKPWPT